MDNARAGEDYELYLEGQAKHYESTCKRCGACCGALDEDPCGNLILTGEGKYSCSNYENRLGIQKTVLGREFNCVPLRKILFESWAGSWKCAYKK